MIEIQAQRAPEVSSIVFHIMMFAGYNQRAVMERPLGYSALQRNLLFSRHGTNCSSPFNISRCPYPGFILVLPGLACVVYIWYPTCNAQRQLWAPGKRERLLTHSHAARFAR